MNDDRFANWQPPKITDNEMTKYHWIVRHPENLKLGARTDIGAFTYINAKHGVEIGESAQIGSHCSIYSISTIDGKAGKVLIGKNAAIGTHSTIMPGVTIGEGAIVGAHSFVTSDIPANMVAFGVPARVRRQK